MYGVGDNRCNPAHPDMAVSILTLDLHCVMNLHMVDRWVLVLTIAAAATAGGID